MNPLRSRNIPIRFRRKLPTGDQRNMAFAGTAVTYGRGRALSLPRVCRLSSARSRGCLKRSTLRRRRYRRTSIASASRWRALRLPSSLSSLCSVFRGQPFVEMLIFGVALAVAVVPEALPRVVTISLALGVKGWSVATR